MQISVSGKQIDVGAALRDYVEAELEDRVQKYFERAISADVVFSKERHQFAVDIIVNEGTGTNVLIKAKGKDESPHAAFDSASEKVAKQLRRYKRRIVDHHKRTAEAVHVAATKFVLSDEAEQEVEATSNEAPLIVAEKNTDIHVFSVSNAMMHMDLSNLPALMFINEKTGAVNVIYRREDGNISWIDSPLVFADSAGKTAAA